MWLYLYDCTVFYTLTASVVCKDTKQDYGSKQSTPGSVVPLAMFHLVHSPTWIHRRSNLLCLESMLERWKGQKIIWKHLFLESHLKWWSYCMVSASLLFGNVCVLVLQTFDTIGVFCFPATIWKYICLFCVLVFPIFDWWEKQNHQDCKCFCLLASSTITVLTHL